MEKTRAEIESSIQSKIDADVDFQTSLNDLSEDDKIKTIEDRKVVEFDKILSDRATKAEKDAELAGNYKTRAEKAEIELKGKKGVVEKEGTSTSISQTDMFALLKANVSEEDIQELVDYASLKKISVKDALKTNFVKSFLADKTEQRKTDDASGTSGRRTVVTKLSDDALLAKALSGDLPETDEDIRRLYLIRQKSKK